MSEIITGAEILTLDPEHGAVEALLVTDGAIVAAGSADELRAADPSAGVSDLGGGCLIPSLVDHHLHLTAVGLALLNRQEEERLFLQLAGARSAAEVIERVEQRAAQAAAGDWILGMGWNQQDWGTTALPHHGALSRAVPDHPVFLVRIDAHSAWVNEAALATAGIGLDASEPEGGRILRLEDGRSAPSSRCWRRFRLPPGGRCGSRSRSPRKHSRQVASPRFSTPDSWPARRSSAWA